MYYQNIDLDKCDKEQLESIIAKVRKQPCCLKIDYKDSSSKGYHIMMICSKVCDTCRFVFDDAKRYEIDFGRDEKFKNTTFTEKEWFRGNMNTIKEKCDRCAKYGNHVTMSKRELEIDEVKEKMKIGKIHGYPYQIVYLAFIYFECPICHWFKFVKKKNMPNVNIEGYNHQ